MSKRHAVKLSNEVIAAWEEAVLGLARLPKGFNRADESRSHAVAAVLKAELSEVRRLWEIFTKDRDELGKFLVGSKPQAVAYLLGFHLPNAARMQLALSRVELRYALSAALKAHAGKVRWHDLGSGSGAMTHALLEYWRTQRLDPAAVEAHATDVSSYLLDAARLVAKSMAPSLDFKTHKLGLENLPAEKMGHDGAPMISLYTLGYVFNELQKNPRARQRLDFIFGRHIAEKEPALVFLLEPATQDLCRAAMEWREGMVAAGYVPIYPCPAAVACPMLERTRDWCYSEGDLHRPFVVATVDRALKIDRTSFASTMFALASPALMEKLKPRAANVAPVVGRPERAPEPRKAAAFDYLVCTKAGLSKVAHDPSKDVLPRGAPAPVKA